MNFSIPCSISLICTNACLNTYFPLFTDQSSNFISITSNTKHDTDKSQKNDEQKTDKTDRKVKNLNWKREEKMLLWSQKVLITHQKQHLLKNVGNQNQYIMLINKVFTWKISKLDLLPRISFIFEFHAAVSCESNDELALW